MNTAGKNGSETSGIHLWLILWKAFRAMEGHAERSIAALGLCMSDFGVLEALLHKGPLTVKALREKVFLASGSMTAAIDRLERRGWVMRGNDPRDRRSRVVHLTVEGRKTIDSLFAAHVQDMEQAVMGLSAGQRAEAAEVLRRIGREAEARLAAGDRAGTGIF